MRWWDKMRAVFAPNQGHEASAAIAAANESHRHAIGQLDAMSRLRAEADEARAEIRAHNVANHFDIWLQEVIRGRG